MTDLQKNEIRTSPELNEYAAALAKAQGEYPEIIKDKIALVRGQSQSGTPYEYSYKYADLSDVLKAVRGPLSKYGLAFTQLTIVEAGTIFVRSRLIHSSGQWMEAEYPVAAYASAAHQKIGGALTYARRYSGCAILGVAAEEDVDAEGAETGAPEKKRAQREPPTVIQVSADKKPLPPTVSDDKATHGPLSITALKAAMRVFAGDLAACEDEGQLIPLLNKSAELHSQCQRDLPDWWFGSGDIEGAVAAIETKRAELAAKELERINPLGAG